MLTHKTSLFNLSQTVDFQQRNYLFLPVDAGKTFKIYSSPQTEWGYMDLCRFMSYNNCWCFCMKAIWVSSVDQLLANLGTREPCNSNSRFLRLTPGRSIFPICWLCEIDIKLHIFRLIWTNGYNDTNIKLISILWRWVKIHLMWSFFRCCQFLSNILRL